MTPTQLREQFRQQLIAIKRSTYWPDLNEPDTMNGGDGPSFQCVTFGVNDDFTDWSYQTGDNSYSGGAYGYPHWAVVWIRPRSNCREIAQEAVDQILDLVGQAA